MQNEKPDYGLLLWRLYYDLHPVYSSTAGRTGGGGGQAVTSVCAVINPDKDTEYDLIHDI